MPTYVVLVNWTEQGIKTYKDAPKRLQASREAFQKVGAKIKDAWFTMGPHDLVVVIDAPNDDVFNRLMIDVGSKGYIRTLSLKAWTPEEFGKVVGG
ncbi:MAG: GYD domain-containing protein [Euryarchaeota archaeon]|nr:GYD domain-containing protein [Euryarchaeota archaeon]MDE1837409.1 GYD domain-containing protein [Euryarchaeota archaeon]MDE1879908.1 GYD domain-containing protein [Euryarchaeota archaeon]MDE2045491.1 GYD domain-containing protein [Thermoplasmata archaeon]